MTAANNRPGARGGCRLASEHLNHANADRAGPDHNGDPAWPPRIDVAERDQQAEQEEGHADGDGIDEAAAREADRLVDVGMTEGSGRYRTQFLG
jgi:hypothetical protein